MKNKLIIFDMDGVLINSEEIHTVYVNMLLNKFGINISLEESRKRYVGQHLNETVKQVEKDFNISINYLDFLKQYQELSKDFLNKIKQMPEAEWVFSNIKYNYCIASSSSIKGIENSLKVVDLYKFFTKKNYFSADTLKKFKPDPAVYLYAMEQMKKEPKNCVAIEDSIVGVQAAHSAGIPVICFTGGKHITKGHDKRALKSGAFTTTNSLKEALEIAEQKLTN